MDWATHEAAKYAVENWHYSKVLPAGKLLKVGIWENRTFIGVVLFGRGASPNLGNPYGLQQDECVELVRVALTKHLTPVSRIVSIAIKFLRKSNPRIRLIVSFADAAQGHHGGIYQAGGWVYAGGSETHGFKVNGQIVHPKTLHNRYGIGGQSVPWLKANVDPNAERIISGFKHRYLMPLDTETRKKVLPLSKPYPKRAGSDTTDTAGLQPAEGGSIPTPALHFPTA